jgi:hypothetical protein
MQKIYMVNSLREHAVWKLTQFWESLLVYQVYTTYTFLNDQTNLQQFNLDIILFDKMAYISQQALFF